MKRRSFLGTIFPLLTLITIIPLVLLYMLSAGIVQDIVNNQTYKIISESAYMIRNLIPTEKLSDKEFISNFCKTTAKNTDIRITVILPNGVVTGDSHKNYDLLENHLSRPEFQNALSGKKGFSERYSDSLHIKMYYFALPIEKEKEVIGLIRVSLPLDISNSILKSAYIKILLITLLLIGGITFFSYYITKKISRPIINLEDSSKGISSLDFTSLKTIDGPTEIYNLSINLKKMSKTLESKFNSAIRQRKELEAVFSSLIESIIVTDENSIIKDINQAALDLFKFANNPLQEVSLIQLTRNSELNKIAEKTYKKKKSQYQTIVLKEQIQGSADKYENQKFTSRDLYLEVNTSLIQTENHSTRVIMVLHDITQLKTLERIRKDFVANVSHELKTPVTSIMGFVETLQNGALNNKKDSIEFLNIIQSQSRRLDLIIKDLLSLSALESFENTEIQLEEHRLADIVSAAIKICQNSIENKKTNINISFSNDHIVKVNSTLMEQALVNLISNAVKYCPVKSTIRIKGEIFPDYSLIRVSDNGPGIPESDIPRVFERFYTVDKARSRELGGTGLGLAIVKHIILAHKGEIRLVSSTKKGSEFIIRIPG